MALERHFDFSKQVKGYIWLFASFWPIFHVSNEIKDLAHFGCFSLHFINKAE
jgi:hypothetical protein